MGIGSHSFIKSLQFFAKYPLDKLRLNRIFACLVTVAMLLIVMPISTFGAEQSQALAITNMDYRQDDKISVILTLSVDMQRKNGTVLVGLYDKNNTLISCKKGTVSQLYTFDKLSDYCGSYTAKAFYFESMTSLKPLCKGASKTLEGKHISNSTKCLSTEICSACGESFTNWHYFAPDEWIINPNLNAHGKLCECSNEHTAVGYHAYCTPVTSGENTLYQCVCGAQSETQSHNFNAWTASDKGHYRICLSCGEKEEEIGHIDAANNVCQKCGYELIQTGTIGGDGGDGGTVVIGPGGGGGDVVVTPDLYHECGKHMNFIGLNDGKDHSKCEHCNGYRCDGRDHDKCEHCNGYICDGGNHNKCELCNGYRCDGRDHLNGLCVFYIH